MDIHYYKIIKVFKFWWQKKFKDLPIIFKVPTFFKKV